ncbi:hypothetical protein ACOSQ2_030432 [Xanthoceras sorbifolium]
MHVFACQYYVNAIRLIKPDFFNYVDAHIDMQNFQSRFFYSMRRWTIPYAGDGNVVSYGHHSRKTSQAVALSLVSTVDGRSSET